MLTSIPLHLQFLRRRKDRDQHCAQVIRLVKWWARRQKAERDGFKCKSFIVELICAKLVDDGVDFSNYPQRARGVLRVHREVRPSGTDRFHGLLRVRPTCPTLTGSPN